MSTIVKEPQQGLRRHKLVTAEIRRALPELKAQDGKGLDATVHLKLFCPYGAGTWLITEFDGDDTFYGYGSAAGLSQAEWGYISYREIAETKVFGRVPAIERDCYIDTMTVREHLS